MDGYVRNGWGECARYLYKEPWSKISVRAHVFASRTWLTASRGKRRFLFLGASHCEFVGPLKEKSKIKRGGILVCRASADLVPVCSVVTGEDAPLLT